jgi:capsular polysaccharide biosynthesis protein
MFQLIVTIILVLMALYLVIGAVFTFFFLPGDYKNRRRCTRLFVGISTDHCSRLCVALACAAQQMA